MKRLGLPIVIDGGKSYIGTVPFAGADSERICAAFSGTVGGACACSIHPDRPTNCREFEASSVACRMARYEAGIPASRPPSAARPRPMYIVSPPPRSLHDSLPLSTLPRCTAVF